MFYNFDNILIAVEESHVDPVGGADKKVELPGSGAGAAPPVGAWPQRKANYKTRL